MYSIGLKKYLLPFRLSLSCTLYFLLNKIINNQVLNKIVGSASTMNNFDVTLIFSVYNKLKEIFLNTYISRNKCLRVSIEILVGNLCLVMSHDILFPRSVGSKAYPQVLPQCTKLPPALALLRVHNREAILT
jgi:hypothetical protein